MKKKIQSYTATLLFCFGTAISPVTAAAEIRELPDEEFVRLLGLHLSGKFVDLENMALQTEAYRSADEFTRAEVLKKEFDRLAAEQKTFSDTTGFTLNINTSIQDYDSEIGGFPLGAMEQRSYVVYGTQINLLNTEAFRHIIMPVDEARKLREATGRGAIVQVTLENIKPVESDSISGEITKAVLIDRTGQKLVEIQPVEAPDLPVYEGGDQKLFSDISAEHGLIAAGASWNDVVKWASSFPQAAAAAGQRGAIQSITDGAQPSDFEPGEGESIYLIASRNSDSLRAAFGVRDRRSGFTSIGMLGDFNFSVLGRNYTCDTDEVGDTCGIVELRRSSAGTWHAAEVVAVTDFNGMTEKDVAKHVLGNRIGYFDPFERSNVISTPALGSAGHGYPQTADSFTLGERTQEGSSLLNIRNEYRPAFGAPYVIHTITDGNRHGAAVFESRVTQEQIDALAASATPVEVQPKVDASAALLPDGKHEGQGDGSTVWVTVAGRDISFTSVASGCSGSGKGTYEATGPGTFLATLRDGSTECTVDMELKDGILTSSPKGCSYFHGFACGFYNEISLK